MVIEELGQRDGASQWSAYSNWDRAMANEQLHPTGLSAVPGDNAGEVALTWTPVADATAHWVWSVRADGTAGKWTAGQAGSAVVGDLEAGQIYWFVVIEELGQRDGASQWSAYSNWDRAMASEQLNSAGLSAVPGDNAGEVALFWTPVADAIAHWAWSVRGWQLSTN